MGNKVEDQSETTRRGFLNLGLIALGLGLFAVVIFFLLKPVVEFGETPPVLGNQENTSNLTLNPISNPAGSVQVWRNIVFYSQALSKEPSQAWLNLKALDNDSISVEDTQQGLFIKFEEPVLAVHSIDEGGLYELDDIEIGLAFQLKREAGEIGLVCRLQPDHQTMYALVISHFEWRLVRILEGNETVLEHGEHNAFFKKGKAGLFHLRCEGDRLTAWDNVRLMAVVADDTLEKGAVGTRLTIPANKMGYIHLASEYVTLLEENREVGYLGDSVQSGDLSVSPSRLIQVFQSRSSDSKLAIIRVVLINRGFQPLIFGSEQVYLQLGNRTISALDVDPGTGGWESVFPLDFPIMLESYQETWGHLLFDDVTNEDLEQDAFLVIDLSELGFTPIRFDLSANQ